MFFLHCLRKAVVSSDAWRSFQLMDVAIDESIRSRTHDGKTSDCPRKASCSWMHT